MYRIALLALFLAIPAQAQTISERVADLERSIADMKAVAVKVDRVEAKVDALTVKVEKLTVPPVTVASGVKVDPCKTCVSSRCTDEICRVSQCEIGHCLAVGGTGSPAPGGTERYDHYEWRVTPGGQYALMRNGRDQVGNMILGDGYYPKLPGDNQWGAKTLPPYPFTMPARIVVPQYPPTGHAVQFGSYPAYSPAFRGVNCGPRG